MLNGPKFYTPDFKVVYPDGSMEYHEIKGWMDQDSILRSRAMKVDHPRVIVKLIDRTKFKRIAKRYAKTIPGWEMSLNHGCM